MSYTIFDSILDCNDNIIDLQDIILFCKQRIKELKEEDKKTINKLKGWEHETKL